MHPTAPRSQFALLLERRFGPFFLTQLAGAFNDSLLKQVLILLVTFHAAEYTTLSTGLVINMAAGLFILPFVLFSALAGQLADRYDKTLVIRSVKAAELVIVGVAAAGFYSHSLTLLMGSVFAMGCHSAFFGPVKYSLLPRVLAKDELTGGNGLLEMGTFLSILGGTLVAGVLVAATRDPFVLSAALFAIAAAGFAASLFTPSTGQAAPDLRISANLFAQTLETVKLARREGEGVWNSLLASSWFWFVGAVVLSQIPALGKDVLHGAPSVVTLLLAVFSVGVGAGSLLCERLSDHKVEIGLVPVGSLGLTLLIADFAMSALSFAAQVPPQAPPLDWSAFLAMSGSWRILLNLTLVGLFGGLYIVPLYAFVQMRTAPERQSRVISANNILNALFMVAAAGLSAALLAAGMSVPHLLLVCAALNALVALHIYRTVPEFLWRFIAWVLAHTVYRLRTQGRHHIPDEGPALLCPNHVTYADALFLSALSPRPIRFVMDHAIFELPGARWLFKTVRAIPIASARQRPDILETAFDEISKALRAGEVVCVFPEGMLTRDGQMNPFRSGFMRVLERDPVPVCPVGLSGLWGSLLCRDGRPLARRLRHWVLNRRVDVRCGVPIPPDQVTPESLQQAVAALRERA